MADFVRHLGCDACGSKDANALYADGSTYCFSCKAHSMGGEGQTEAITSPPRGDKPKADFRHGSYQDLTKRKITQATCEHFGYQVDDGAHIAPYKDPVTGVLVAQKIRMKDKKFSVIGGGKNMPLFGQHIWGNTGKSVVITEGEIDALSVAQAFNCKWPVVSLPNGAQAAATSIKNAYDWLCGYEKIVLCFDADAPGVEATEEVAGLLPPGKCFIMRLPEGCKDANDVLVKHGTAPLTQAFWNASLWRPDGIVSFGDLREKVLNPKVTASIPLPWPLLNEMLHGLRTGEITTVTSGSGMGKSTFIREIIYHLASVHEQSVGCMLLEESNERSASLLTGLHLNKNFVVHPYLASPEEKAEAFDYLAGLKLYLWDHFGSNEIDDVLKKIRFMVKVLGIRWLILDHLSILVSGLDGDERKTIDMGMTKLRTLVSELDIGMILVSHLKRPSGDNGHEDGAKISLSQLRGSHAIVQLSDNLVGLQASGDEEDTATTAVVLKNRFDGSRKGAADRLNYDSLTGRLLAETFGDI